MILFEQWLKHVATVNCSFLVFLSTKNHIPTDDRRKQFLRITDHWSTDDMTDQALAAPGFENLWKWTVRRSLLIFYLHMKPTETHDSKLPPKCRTTSHHHFHIGRRSPWYVLFGDKSLVFQQLTLSLSSSHSSLVSNRREPWCFRLWSSLKPRGTRRFDDDDDDVTNTTQQQTTMETQQPQHNNNHTTINNRTIESKR